MSNRVKVSSRPERTKGFPEQIDQSGEVDPEYSSPVSPDLADVDSWEDVEREWPGLLEAESGEDIEVGLIRLWPETWRDASNQEVQCRGYVGVIPPGMASPFDYIRTHFGGGKYLLRIRKNGKFGAQRQVRVSGPPLFTMASSVQLPGPSPSAITPPPPTRPPEPDPLETYKDISLGGSDGDFERRVSRLMILRSLLEKPTQPQPQDINAVLLQHILNTQAPPATTTDQVKDILDLVGTVREMAPAEQASGGDWIEKLIGLVTTLITKSIPIPGTGANLPVRRLPEITLTKHPPVSITPAETGPGGGKIAAEPAADAAGSPLSTTPKTEENHEMTKPTLQQLGATAVHIITNAYELPGHTPVAEVVQALDLLIPPDADTSMIALMVPRRGYIFTIIKNQLVPTLETEDDVKELEAWFNKVFDQFCDPQRERATWG